MRRRRPHAFLALAGMLAALAGQPAAAQRRASPAPQTATRPSGPPHAWLFGRWTGGLFPVLDTMLDQDCRTQTTVVFAQDAVAHASLLGTGATQRVIETVRTSPAGAEFRLTPDPADPGGFGCEDPNVLHVQRSSATEISFPHCAAFPYPLKRCPTPGQ